MSRTPELDEVILELAPVDHEHAITDEDLDEAAFLLEHLTDEESVITVDDGDDERWRAIAKSLRAAAAAARTGLLVTIEPTTEQCRSCGCTNDDCSGCVERTGGPCWWVAPYLCSACVDQRGVVLTRAQVEAHARAMALRAAIAGEVDHV